MKRLPRILVALSVCAILIAAAGRLGQVQAAGKDSNMPVDPKLWEGKWKTNFGILETTVSEHNIKGTYTWDQGKIVGQIAKHGTDVSATWSESPDYKPPKNAGKVTWTLSADHNSFTGTWGYGDSFTNGTRGGTWTGVRVTAASAGD